MNLPVTEIIPSEGRPNGLAALRETLQGARAISAAVAFVTESGVERLGQILEEAGSPEVEIVARAGGVTSPDALLALHGEEGINVSVMIGCGASTFHPKLWLARSNDRLSVLSGSGNLTQGGLVDNKEQFELSQMPIESEAAHQQEARFDDLTFGAVRLDKVVGTTIWAEWETVLIKQRLHRREIDRLEGSLNQREIRPGRQRDRELLIADLLALYEMTVTYQLMTKQGRRYVPTRFLQGIHRAETGGDPVQLVYRICRYQTEGFDVILEADRPDLTVESLVVDAAKPYHDLFTESTRRLSAERLKQFPSWPGGSQRSISS